MLWILMSDVEHSRRDKRRPGAALAPPVHAQEATR